MKKESIFRKEVRRDLTTFRRLHGKKRLRFVWDYFRFKILAAVTAVIIILTFANLLWQGQKPCRLRVCAVLNTEDSCAGWFNDFYKDLKQDGKKGALDLDEDQPFDYDNAYYYIQELEVQTKVASQRIDVAICGPDMYSYLLSLKACLPLDTALPEDQAAALLEKGQLIRSTAGLRQAEDGSTDTSEAEEGYYAADLTDTAFGHTFNDGQKTEEGQEKAPLYAVIISNTDHMEDSIRLLEALFQQKNR